MKPAVSTDELRAIRGPRRLQAAEVCECDPSGEIGVPETAREDRARCLVEAGHDERRGRPGESERPLYVSGDRDPPTPIRAVLYEEMRNFDGIFRRHELDDLKPDAVRRVLEAAVASTVASDV